MKKVLIMEDELNIRSFVVINLKRAGYDAIEAGTGQEALDQLAANPDIGVAILDIMVPGEMDGFEVCRRVRATNKQMGIIMLTARDEEVDKVLGLELGADDYMTKPFSVLELIARVKTNIRRANLYVTSQKGFVIDNNVYKIFYEGHDLGLTLKEFKLLKMLIARAGVTIEREELFREVWGETFMGETRTLDIHISQLRDKITECGGGDVIVTVRGIGYRFVGQ